MANEEIIYVHLTYDEFQAVQGLVMLSLDETDYPIYFTVVCNALPRAG